MADRRRIQGPEVTVMPIIIKSSDNKEKIHLKDVNGRRRDGRNLEDTRPICMYSGNFLTISLRFRIMFFYFILFFYFYFFIFSPKNWAYKSG